MKEFLDQPKVEQEDIEKTTKYIFDNGKPLAEGNDERNYLDDDKRPADIEAEDFFRPINPYGYMLADVKKELEEEIENKIRLINSTKNSLQSQEQKKIIISTEQFQIKDLEKWVSYLDFYLSSSAQDPIHELKIKIEEEKGSLEDLTKNQKYSQN